MEQSEDRAAVFSPSESDKRWRKFAWFLYPFMKISFIPFGGDGNFRKKTVAFANPRQGESVLDACCGTGALTNMIAEKVGNTGRVNGIDISEKAIRKASDKIKDGLPLTFRQASCAAIPFPDKSFDKVFISFGLHEMGETDRLRSLNEVKRVLKDGGSFFVLEYNLPRFWLKRFAVRAFNWLFESKSAYRMLIDNALPGYLEQAGFSIRQRQTLGAEIFQILHTARASAEKNDA
ncbi:class I SAM-dependent methyltransferase [Chloroflexota bacterium]